MIRRDATRADGSAKWVLISQIEHARLAGTLAEHWASSCDALTTPGIREELLAVIYKHDDGWIEWERSPGVDAQHGRPLAFTEMPLDESVAIWQASIQQARTMGSLAPLLVAWHFSALLGSSNPWQSSTGFADETAQKFVKQYEVQCAQWLDDWKRQSQPGGQRTDETAQRALAHLQFFDALSLWFCCTEQSEPNTIETSCRSEITLRSPASEQITISPWPLTVDQLTLEVSGNLVAAERYANSDQRAATPHEPVTLRWELTAG